MYLRYRDADLLLPVPFPPCRRSRRSTPARSSTPAATPPWRWTSPPTRASSRHLCLPVLPQALTRYMSAWIVAGALSCLSLVVESPTHGGRACYVPVFDLSPHPTLFLIPPSSSIPPLPYRRTSSATAATATWARACSPPSRT
jgi:hypothetical protein